MVTGYGRCHYSCREAQNAVVRDLVVIGVRSDGLVIIKVVCSEAQVSTWDYRQWIWSGTLEVAGLAGQYDRTYADHVWTEKIT